MQDFYQWANLTNTRQVDPKSKKIFPVYVPEYDMFGPYFYLP